jgi:serine/threonine protein kinase
MWVADSGVGCGDVGVLKRYAMYSTISTLALHWRHSKGIVHCDTSSANTLITNSLDIVLCDFSSSMLDGKRLGNRAKCSGWYKFVDQPRLPASPPSPQSPAKRKTKTEMKTRMEGMKRGRNKVRIFRD